MNINNFVLHVTLQIIIPEYTFSYQIYQETLQKVLEADSPTLLTLPAALIHIYLYGTHAIAANLLPKSWKFGGRGVFHTREQLYIIAIFFFFK